MTGEFSEKQETRAARLNAYAEAINKQMQEKAEAGDREHDKE